MTPWVGSWHWFLGLSNFRTLDELRAFLLTKGMLSHDWPSDQAFTRGFARLDTSRIPRRLQWHTGRMKNLLATNGHYLRRKDQWKKACRDNGGVSAIVGELSRGDYPRRQPRIR